MLRRWGLVAAFLLFFPVISFAGMPFVFCSEMHPSVTGMIHGLGRNEIEIVDENDGRVKRFAYFYQDKSLTVGQRVRVFFTSGIDLVERLEKMTPVEYNKDGHNAGYIFKK